MLLQSNSLIDRGRRSETEAKALNVQKIGVTQPLGYKGCYEVQ